MSISRGERCPNCGHAMEDDEWRPLTSDPALWPEEGQLILLYDGDVTYDTTHSVTRVAVAMAHGFTHWLPLPDPPEVTP